MNIYKQQYSSIKQQLKIFGEKIELKRFASEVRYSSSFWERNYMRIVMDNSQSAWDKLFFEYMYFGCNSEERKFIDLLFFQCQKIVYVSVNFPLSERACQEWREEVLKNLAGLAIQYGLLRIDIKNLKKGDCAKKFEKDAVF